MKTTALCAALLFLATASAAGQGCWPSNATPLNGCPHYDATKHVCWLDVEEIEHEVGSQHSVVHLTKGHDKLAFCTSDSNDNKKFKIWKFTELAETPDHQDCTSPVANPHDPFPDHYPINGDTHGNSKTTRLAANLGCFKTTLQRKDLSPVDPHIIIDPEVTKKKDGGKKPRTSSQPRSSSGGQCWPATANKADLKMHCPHYDPTTNVCWVGLEEKEYFAPGHPAIHLKANQDQLAFCSVDRPFRILEFREMDPNSTDCSMPLATQRDPFQDEHYPKHDGGHSDPYTARKITNKPRKDVVGGCFKSTLERPDLTVIDPHIIIDQ